MIKNTGVENTLKEKISEDGRILNQILIDYFRENKPFSCIRLGNTENYIFNCLYNNSPIHSRYHYESMCTVAGVFPNDLHFYENEYKDEIIKSIKNSDLIGWVAITQPNPTKKVSDDLLSDKICFSHIEVLDPCDLAIEYENPWTMELKNKKVLVVSSMSNTIKRQWENKNKIWGEYVDKILPFTLVDVIKSPHNPDIEGGKLFSGNKELKNWLEVKEYLESEIDSYDYDVLLVGCGALAPVLASHSKSKGKIAITTCGNTQLFFGICGSRWTLNKGWVNFPKCYNEHWSYPDPEDVPLNCKILESTEGKCYW
jgi:hypothetical protein